MRIPTWGKWFGPRASAGSDSRAARADLRIGIPKVLNIWSTHQFWCGLFVALGIRPENLVFSSDTSEEQNRQFGKGRGTVDCCYPVKCMSGHYGELVFGQKKKLDIIVSPLIYTLPSILRGNVLDTLTCPRVMAGPENIKAGFLKERDVFTEQGIRYVSPLVSLGDPRLVPAELHPVLGEVLPGLTLEETREAVAAGYRALDAFNTKLRQRSRAILEACARNETPCLLVLARPYHMDPGIGHEIEVDLQAYGYPVLWGQYLPTDDALMEYVFGDDIQAGHIRTPFDIADVWPSSYSSNTNEVLWGAKFGARVPWVACIIRLASYECGMDQPTYTPVQQIVERSGTLFFSFQELDSTKPAGSVKIRVETIAHYLEKYAAAIIGKKKQARPGEFPFAAESAAAAVAVPTAP